MKILLVEDNPSVRRLIRRAASEIADEIVECEDGADSLAAYTAHRPDLVLMDVRMPRMDGLAATRILLARYPEARVIIVTDYNDEELRAAAREVGALAFALKHNLTELDAMILEVYGRAS
jgi:CheY-like chemotaxis protein